MAKLTHDQLQTWYTNFKKALYEGANIDMDRIEDIGRLKTFYATLWNVNEPLGTEGDLMYTCIPHQDLDYDNPPPEFDNPQERLEWLMNNLQIPTTDEQIEKMYEMSREGTLMAFGPGGSEANMQQVYTDDLGQIRVSPPMSSMTSADAERVEEKYRLPAEPSAPVPEADPAEFGLEGCPPKPVEPENMEPGFFSWIGYLLGFDTDFAKLKHYRDDVATYDERYEKWYDGLNDENDGVMEYKAAKNAREQYVAEVEAYWANPLGKVSSIDNGLRGYRTSLLMQDSESYEKIQKYLIAERDFLKEQHGKLPQGKILKDLEDINTEIGYAKRTRNIVRNLVGSEANPMTLVEWRQARIFKAEDYKPQKYDVPRHPDADNVSAEERSAYKDKMLNLAEVAGFAATSDPSVNSNKLIDGFNAEDSAKLNYTKVLDNLFTTGRQNSDNYVVLLEPARMKAKEALEAYHNGELGPMAELLANSVRMTNREAACLSSLDSAHSMNTLYLVGRLWNVLQDDPKLLEATGLTPEEIEETKANVALHQAMTKGLESKKALLEHALYRREMTANQIAQAGADILFAYNLTDNVRQSYADQTNSIAEKPEYKNALANLRENPEKARAQLNLLDLDRPGHAIGKKLLNADWIKEAKDALRENCNLNRLSAMSREEMGKLLLSNIAFRDAFRPQEARQPKVNVPVNANALQNEAQVQQQAHPQNAM